jgi:hypothetical protein
MKAERVVSQLALCASTRFVCKPRDLACIRGDTVQPVLIDDLQTYTLEP